MEKLCLITECSPPAFQTQKFTQQHLDVQVLPTKTEFELTQGWGLESDRN